MLCKINEPWWLSVAGCALFCILGDLSTGEWIWTDFLTPILLQLITLTIIARLIFHISLEALSCLRKEDPQSLSPFLSHAFSSYWNIANYLRSSNATNLMPLTVGWTKWETLQEFWSHHLIGWLRLDFQEKRVSCSLKGYSTFFWEIGSFYNSPRVKQLSFTIFESIQPIFCYLEENQ